MYTYDTAIIGNGFDLYYNQPTRYENFYNFMKDIHTLSKEEVVNKYYNCNIEEKYNYFKSFLDSNIFLIYFIKYNQLFDSWTAFENELLDMLSKFDEMLKLIEDKRYSYGKYDKGEATIYLNNVINYEDILSIIEECSMFKYKVENIYGIVSNNLIIKLDLPNDSNSRKIENAIKKYVDDFPKKLYEELENFCKVFCEYLKMFVNIPSVKSLNRELSAENVVNYNYTSLAQSIFQPKGLMSYIHGTLEKEIVLGIDSSNNTLNRFFYFFKRIQRVSKRTDYNKIFEIARRSGSVVIIGHSLDEADDDSLKLLLNRNNYRKITVYYYNKDKFSKSILAYNLCRILGNERFDLFSSFGILELKPLPES